MKFKETQVIVLANQKGGCGKTTSSTSIAAAFNKLGYSVAIVDCDPQANCTNSFGIDPEELFRQQKLTLLDVYLNKRAGIDLQIGFEKERFDDRLFVLPGNKQIGEVGFHLELQAISMSRFNSAEIDLDQIRDENRTRLRDSLKSLKGIHDVIIIDTPPNLGFLMTSALVAADWFIIPVFPSKYDLAGLEELTVTINKIRVRYNPTLKLAGVLLGNFDRTTKLDSQIYQMLAQKFLETSLFETTISRGVKMRELTFSNKTIFEFADTAKQAEEFLALVKEMINRASKGENTTKPLPKLEQVVQHAESSSIDLNLSPDQMKEVSNG